VNKRLSDSTTRFSNRVDDYTKYRPKYPQASIDYMLDGVSVSDDSVIADVGSGTGILTEALLPTGAKVIAVEPNDSMRSASDQRLGQFSNYESVGGKAENTGLARHSVDLITAAQAFHWFELEPTRNEFSNIIKPGGHIALIWNRRVSQQSEFLLNYEKLLSSKIVEYSKVNHTNASDEVIKNFLGNQMQIQEFENHQMFDLEGLCGRLMSSSYCPAVGEPGHQALMDDLEALFDAHAENGRVQFDYVTQVYKAAAG